MSTLQKLFEDKGATLFQNESIALDHYYLEPYQDANDDDADTYDMTKILESSPIKTKRKLEIPKTPFSLFHYFLDGSRRTYKIGDLVIAGKKIYPVIAAQVRAGCARRIEHKISKQTLLCQNYLLISSSFNDVDFDDIKARLRRCTRLSPPVNVETHSIR